MQIRDAQRTEKHFGGGEGEGGGRQGPKPLALARERTLRFQMRTHYPCEAEVTLSAAKLRGFTCYPGTDAFRLNEYSEATEDFINMHHPYA